MILQPIPHFSESRPFWDTEATTDVWGHYDWRIETSYRVKNLCRIRTTTKHPVVRFLYMALAFILVNLWIWLLWTRLSRSRRGGRRVYRERFPLKTMLEFLCHAIERRFPLIQAISLPATG
jgi:putative transposase